MKTKAAQFIFLAAGTLLVWAVGPLFVHAQTSCSSLASLSVTSSKTTYQVGETFSGEVVFTNNTGPADVNFDVKAVKSGQTLISKNYTLTTQLGRNVYQLTDALGASSLPEAGTYIISVIASYPPLGCTWNANLTLTVPAPPTPPHIDSLNTSSAPFDSTVTINGSGFGFIPFGNNIESGSVVIGRNIFSPDGKTLVFTVPDVYPGPYPLSVSNANGTSNEAIFTVTPAKPWIQSIDPSSAQPGTQVTIKGGNFTTAVGNDIKSGATVIAANVLSPDGKTLVFTVPEVTPGTFPISVFSSWYLRGTSNEVSFTVLPPPPVKLLTSLVILPSEYLLGQTVTGSVTVTNPTPKEIKADFGIELYKDATLLWQRKVDSVSIGAGITNVNLDTVFGFKPTIPDDPFYVGNWKLTIRRTDTPTINDSVSQAFIIKAPVVQPLTLTFNFDPKEYLLGDTLQGQGAVTNPGSSPVNADFKIELFQASTLKWQREIKGISIPPGTANFTVDDLFGSRVVIPNEVSLIGDWKLKITQMGTTPPVSVESSFSIKSITAACKPTTGTPMSGVFGIIKGWFPWNTEPRHLDAMKELGVKWTRVELRWDQIEKEKGKFDWSFYDIVLKNFDENNIKVLGSLSGVPCWANGRACQEPGIDEHYPPNNLNDWANFVKRAVNRYKPDGEITLKNPVIHWEVWNEPNIDVFWRPQPDARAYTNLLAVSNKAIREADPKAIIGTAGFAGIPQDFVDELYNQGAKNCFDTINFHPYGRVKELKPKTEAIKKYLAEHNDANKPIWYTEYGFVTGESGTPGPVGPKVSEQEQAQYVKETYDLFKQGVINNLFWISLVDLGEGLAGGDFGLLRRDFTKKPAFDVLKNLLNPTTGISINVDAAKSIGRISSHFFGAGHENNADFIIPDNLRLQTIRYRAGCDVEEFYHWRDYVGPVVQQYRYGCYGNNPGGALLGPFAYPNPMRTNYYIESLDDALTYLKQKGIEVILGVNFGTGSAQEGANYVEYVNGISPGLDYGRLLGWTATSYRGDEKAPAGYFAWLREHFGYRNPYNVKYWSIGNEWHVQTSGMSWTGNPEKYFHGGTDRPKSFTNAMFGPFKLEGKLPMTRKADRMDWSELMKVSDGTPNQSFYGPFAPAVRGTQVVYVTAASYNPDLALQEAIKTFREYLSGKGYSPSEIDTALSYVSKYLANPRDSEVRQFLASLTPQQRQDILDAFKRAQDKYNSLFIIIGPTEIWQEVPDITKAGRGKYYQFFPEEARVLFGDGIHGDIPPRFYIITTNYNTGPHDGFLQYAQKMKSVDPNINIGVVIDGLDMEHVVIPQDVQPYVGYIAANMYFGPPSPQVVQDFGLEEGYYYLVTRAPGEAIKNARAFMEKNYGGANRWPIFNTEWADLGLRTMTGMNVILAHSIYAADTFRTQAQNGVDISIIWALPDLNPSAYYFRALAYDYLTLDGLVVNLYQEHFGKNLIEAVANQKLFDYYREAGKLLGAEQRFKNFLLSKGYSTEFVNRAWEMAVIARDNGAHDPRVIEYLNSLTPKQKDDVLSAYITLSAPFNLIETLASKSDDGKKVYVLVINKHYKDSKTVTINLNNFAGPSASIKADTYLLTSGSVLDQNSPSEPRKVNVQKSSKTFAGNSFLYDAPSHSVTFIEFYRQ